MPLLLAVTTVAALLAAGTSPLEALGTPRTLVAVFAPPDDELSVGPVLARYAREGVRVHLIIATDGAQGAANTKAPRGPAVARLRVEEARCATEALGIQPPVLLGFPDASLGHYLADPGLLMTLTMRLQEELQRLRPEAILTWGPDGGSGHPDHRLVSAVVTQLARAGAPGVPSRVFYSTIPAEAFRALNPERGAPPFLVPQASLFTTRVPFTAADLEASGKSMACHQTQWPPDAVHRMTEAMKGVWKGELPLAPMVPAPPSDDLFK